MRTPLILAAACVTALWHENPPAVDELYRRLIIACTAFDPPRLKAYLDHVGSNTPENVLDSVSPEVLHRLQVLVGALTDVPMAEPAFETLQMRPTATGDTALERWFQPHASTRFNPLIDTATERGGLDVALVSVLLQRRQVRT